jgi:hypothetical protein
MIRDRFTKYFFLNFEIKIIKYSPINQQKGHNFEYLQEGIVFVSLIIKVQSRLDRLKSLSMTMRPIKKGD